MSLGFTEIILIVVLALVLFGGGKLAKNALSTEGQELMNAAEKAAAKEEKQEKEQA